MTRTSTYSAAGLRASLAMLACVGASLALAQSAELPNRHDVLEGITAAGQPSAAALEAAAKAGYKTVIDLRPLTEDTGSTSRPRWRDSA